MTGNKMCIDLTGLRFERLTVLSRAENSRRGAARWNVRCDCGKELAVIGNNLKRKHTRSCGCLMREAARNIMRRVGVHRGLDNHLARVTESDVREIRAQFAEGGRTMQSIADEWGMSKTAIQYIIRRKTWTHI